MWWVACPHTWKASNWNKLAESCVHDLIFIFALNFLQIAGFSEPCLYSKIRTVQLQLAEKLSFSTKLKNCCSNNKFLSITRLLILNIEVNNPGFVNFCSSSFSQCKVYWDLHPSVKPWNVLLAGIIINEWKASGSAILAEEIFIKNRANAKFLLPYSRISIQLSV